MTDEDNNDDGCGEEEGRGLGWNKKNLARENRRGEQMTEGRGGA